MIKRNLNDVNPIFKIEKNNLIITKKGVYSRVLKLSLNPIFSLDKEDYEKMNKEFSSFFHFIPENTIIHKSDIYYKDKYIPNNSIYDNDILTNAYERKFNEYPYLHHECFITFSKTTDKFIKSNSSHTGIYKKDIIDPKILDNDIKDEFETAIQQIINICKDSKYFSLSLLNFEELSSLFISYLNLDFKSDNKYTSDINFINSNLKIGNKHTSILAVNQIECFDAILNGTNYSSSFSTENSEIHFSGLYPIGLGIKENHIVNQVFIKGEKEKIIVDVEKKLKNINFFKSAKDIQKENDGFVDSKKLEIIQFLEEMEKDHLPIRTHINIILWNENIDELKISSENAITSFNKINIKANIVTNEKLALYFACFPGNIADIGVVDQTFLLLDVQAAALNIFETITKDSVGDFGIRLSDRLSGVPLYVDISDEPLKKGLTNNRNKIIFEPSGSGKSFFTNHVLHNYLRQGAHVVVVDVGYSYDRLCLKEKGVFYEYDKDNPLKFNPFFLNKEGLSIEKKESLITLLFTLWKDNIGDENKDEYALLSRAIDMFYKEVERKNLFPCFNTLYEFLQTTFLQVLIDEKKEDLFNHNSFFTVLSLFYKGGEYDHLLNATENLDLINEKFIVFELDNIKDHKILFPVVTLMIMDTFISKMRHPDLANTRKVILIEEAWKAIAKEGMAHFLQYLYKTVRKFFGEAFLVTQEVEDILGSEIIKNAIIKNCGAKILLDMREYIRDMDRIQNLLSLTNKAKDQILSLNQNKIPNERYKEVFIGLGNEGNVYGVNLSLSEYATYTTEKTEKNIIMDYYDKYKDIEMAIEQYAEDLKTTI